MGSLKLSWLKVIDMDILWNIMKSMKFFCLFMKRVILDKGLVLVRVTLLGMNGEFLRRLVLSRFG
jgi:hypothetical protein